MNTQETILQLEELKLKGMAECYKALQSMPASQRPALDTFIARLAEAERQYRNRKRTEMYLKTSKLRYNAVMEDVICSEERNLGKEMLLELMDCTFIDRAENLLIDGRTGCGKSFLACAIGRQACFIRRQDRMREIVPGMCHRKTGLLHGTQGGILLHEQVHRAYSARQT